MSAIPNMLSPLLSLGLGYARIDFKDTSKVTTQVPSYELFAQSYLSTPWNDFFLRPALRFSYDSTTNLEKPSALSIDESTFKSALETGVLYNGLVVPSLTVQAGFARRTLTLNRTAPVETQSPDLLSNREYLWFGSLGLGLGLPIANGLVILEPFWRAIRIERDDRQQNLWGCDLSFALPVFQAGSIKDVKGP